MGKGWRGAHGNFLQEFGFLKKKKFLARVCILSFVWYFLMHFDLCLHTLKLYPTWYTSVISSVRGSVEHNATILQVAGRSEKSQINEERRLIFQKNKKRRTKGYARYGHPTPVASRPALRLVQHARPTVAIKLLRRASRSPSKSTNHTWLLAPRRLNQALRRLRCPKTAGQPKLH